MTSFSFSSRRFC